MPDQVSELVKRGRALAPEDRERLVDQLLESLNEPAAAELNAAWETEIERVDVPGSGVSPSSRQGA
jgi:hypothetical protein